MAKSTELRAGLPPLPPRIARLPIDARGYPTPWFVFTNTDGTRDFRIADAGKRIRAVERRLCWICGDQLGRQISFVIGPMCAVNRNTAEPGSHYDCARFALQACPFLVLPKAQYRQANLPEDLGEAPGHALAGNPGAAALWTTRSFRPYRIPSEPRQWLIEVGEPTSVEWWSEGKPATRARVLECLYARLPLLEKIAREDGDEASLEAQVQRVLTHYLPKEEHA